MMLYFFQHWTLGFVEGFYLTEMISSHFLVFLWEKNYCLRIYKTSHELLTIIVWVGLMKNIEASLAASFLPNFAYLSYEKKYYCLKIFMVLIPQNLCNYCQCKITHSPYQARSFHNTTTSFSDLWNGAAYRFTPKYFGWFAPASIKVFKWFWLNFWTFDPKNFEGFA
jgi:hypothetical protein